jgi:ribosome-binding protein aMBF1 (putative translation factor)
MINLNEMKTHKEVMKEFLNNPKNKKVYDSLEVEFAIYNALVKARIEKKLTQKQLAKQLGIAQSALARFESGRTNPTLSFLQKVTSGLGLRLTII